MPIAGNKTKAVPMIGNSAQRVVTIAQATGDVIPRNQKARPVRPPWIAAIAMVPYAMAFTVSLTHISSRRTWLGLRGRTTATRRSMNLPSRNKKNRIKNAISAFKAREVTLPTTPALIVIKLATALSAWLKIELCKSETGMEM